MYKKDDYVLYRHDVCKIIDIKKKYINGKDYYIMTPINDDSMTMNIPVENKRGYLKDIISKDDAEELINIISSIKPLDNINDKSIENRYKELIANGDRKDLIRIIKTTYTRNDNRKKENKKISDKDDKYFKLVEKYLYNELAIALNMSFNEVKNYIIDKVEKSQDN